MRNNSIGIEVMNKIGDLHRAGFSHKEIADELELTETQVKTIRKYQSDYSEKES